LGARLLLAVERTRPSELDRPDVLVADPQREDTVLPARLARSEQRRLRPEELLRLPKRALEHLARIERAGDRPERLHERFELVLDDLVPPPLGDDQVEREPGSADDRRREAGEREPARAQRQAQQRDDRRQGDDRDEQACSSR